MRRYVGLFILIGLAIILYVISPIGKQTNITLESNPPNDVEEQVKQVGQAVQEVKVEGDKNSLHHFIGQSKDNVLERFGEPHRVDPSAYDYEWWIYKKKGQYSQFGILNNKVVTVYALGKELNVTPFHIGQPLAEFENLIDKHRVESITVQGNKYQFKFTDEDKELFSIVKIDTNIYAQLYIDSFTNELSSIRYVDGETLIKQRPFDLVYFGSLLNPKEISEEEMNEVRAGESKQIFDMTNVIRERYSLSPVEWDEKTAQIAYNHSQEMYTSNYFSHTSPYKGELADRLKEGDIFYMIAGENIAAKYIDAPSVVEGWLNSEGHRKTLLNEHFTHLGVGVYNNYYTQNFIQIWD